MKVTRRSCAIYNCRCNYSPSRFSSIIISCLWVRSALPHWLYTRGSSLMKFEVRSLRQPSSWSPALLEAETEPKTASLDIRTLNSLVKSSGVRILEGERLHGLNRDGQVNSILKVLDRDSTYHCRGVPASRGRVPLDNLLACRRDGGKFLY